MEKEIHFYECRPYELELDNIHVDYSWEDTQLSIDRGIPIIRTTQMGVLSTNLFDLGYRIFVHENPWSSYEIVLGSNNERTVKEIRKAHNLFKMWRANAFRNEDERELYEQMWRV